MLFDDMNLTFEELARAKKAGLETSERMLADSNIAVVVSTSEKTNRVGHATQPSCGTRSSAWKRNASISPVDDTQVKAGYGLR